MRADIVIAARGGPAAKSRCAAALSLEGRARLTEAMLFDMLHALAGQGNDWSVHVVTPTGALAAIAAAQGARVIAEGAPRGLNAALTLARTNVAAPHGRPVLFLPGDLPLLDVVNVRHVLSAWTPGRAVLVPTRDGGTGAVVLGGHDSFEFRFGSASLAAHVGAAREAGLTPSVLEGGTLALDLDLPEDAARAALARPHSLTARALRTCTAIRGAAA